MTDLYKISTPATEGNSFKASLSFNPAHPVFKGHFPGQPVVPGVVMVEIATTIASNLTGKQLVLKEASVIKFIQAVDPSKNTDLEIVGSIVEEIGTGFKLEMKISEKDQIFVKMKGLKLEEVK